MGGETCERCWRLRRESRGEIGCEWTRAVWMFSWAAADSGGISGRFDVQRARRRRMTMVVDSGGVVACSGVFGFELAFKSNAGRLERERSFS